MTKEKELAKLNEWILQAKDQLAEMQSLLEIEMERYFKLLSDIDILSNEKNLLQRDLLKIKWDVAEVVDLARRATKVEREKLEKIKRNKVEQQSSNYLENLHAVPIQ